LELELELEFLRLEFLRVLLEDDFDFIIYYHNIKTI